MEQQPTVALHIHDFKRVVAATMITGSETTIDARGDLDELRPVRGRIRYRIGSFDADGAERDTTTEEDAKGPLRRYAHPHQLKLRLRQGAHLPVLAGLYADGAT
jgi:hypothetical protein